MAKLPRDHRYISTSLDRQRAKRVPQIPRRYTRQLHAPAPATVTTGHLIRIQTTYQTSTPATPQLRKPFNRKPRQRHRPPTQIGLRLRHRLMTRYPLHRPPDSDSPATQIKIRAFDPDRLAPTQPRTYGHQQPCLKRMAIKTPQQPTHLRRRQHPRLIPTHARQANLPPGHIVVRHATPKSKTHHSTKHRPRLPSRASLVKGPQP